MLVVKSVIKRDLQVLSTMHFAKILHFVQDDIIMRLGLLQKGSMKHSVISQTETSEKNNPKP